MAKATSSATTIAPLTTASMAARTNTDWSNSGSMVRPGGADARISASFSST